MGYITDIYSALFKYISNLNISLKLSLYESSQRKSIKYHCTCNLNRCDQIENYSMRYMTHIYSALLKDISNLNISLKLSLYQSSQRKSIKYHCMGNLNQLRSSWKLLNGIHNRYLLRLVQIHFKFEHFSEVISISVISKKIYQISLYVQLKPLRSNENYSMR